MSTKSMRILNVAAGVLLIAAGIYCLCNQDVAVLSAGVLLGVFLLLSGIAEIVVFAAASSVMLGSGWLLLDGVLTVIMSLFLLFNQWFTLLSLPFFLISIPLNADLLSFYNGCIISRMIPSGALK